MYVFNNITTAYPHVFATSVNMVCQFQWPLCLSLWRLPPPGATAVSKVPCSASRSTASSFGLYAHPLNHFTLLNQQVWGLKRHGVSENATPQIASFSMMLSHWIWGFMVFSNKQTLGGFNQTHMGYMGTTWYIYTVFTRWFQLFETMFRPRTWAAMCQNRIPQNKMIYSQKRLSLPPKARYEILTHGKQCMTPTSGLKGSVYFEWTMCISFKAISLCLMAF